MWKNITICYAWCRAFIWDTILHAFLQFKYFKINQEKSTLQQLRLNWCEELIVSLSPEDKLQNFPIAQEIEESFILWSFEYTWAHLRILILFPQRIQGSLQQEEQWARKIQT